MSKPQIKQPRCQIFHENSDRRSLNCRIDIYVGISSNFFWTVYADAPCLFSSYYQKSKQLHICKNIPLPESVKIAIWCTWRKNEQYFQEGALGVPYTQKKGDNISKRCSIASHKKNNEQYFYISVLLGVHIKKWTIFLRSVPWLYIKKQWTIFLT